MLKPSTTTDPVTEAASSEGAARSTTPAALAIRKARRLSRGASEGEAALNAAREILPMIADHPRALELQLVAARMFEKSRIRDEARAVWRGVHDRWPEAEEPFRMLLRWTVRDQGVAAARAELDARYPKMPQDSVSEQLAYARCLTEVRAHGEAATVYKMVLNREPCHEEALTNFVKFATSRGEPWVAYDALQRAGQHGPLPRALERKRQEHALNASWLVEELQSDLHAQGAAPNPCEGRRDLVLASSTGSALRAAAIRKAVMSSDVLRRPFERRRRALGPIVMINSSLATGGAERQFVRVARHLHKAAKDERVIGSTTVSGDVEVWCRSLVSRPDAGFFAADLREAGVPVREIRNFVEDKNPALAAPLSSIAAYEQWLPRDMVWGLQRMSRKLLVKAPEVVSIWQDGMIGVSALAALMAGVPRIVLNFRGMPPSQRLHLLKPEYEPLYTALLNAPNVAFTANSEASARAYAEWLNVDEGRFHVIYNGVDTPSATGSQSDTIRWAEFEMRTGVDGAETLGAVMRFDENKRPFEWLEIAARVLARRPQARFVLVGAGPLWNEAQ
ncbi:MAG: glycosyltransferase, partial [Pseudomonadota bacterium]